MPSPFFPYTSRPFGLSSLVGVKVTVNVPVRHIRVATRSRFSLRTPFASTSCSACRHSASASRFGDMVQEIYALRGGNKSEAFMPERRRRACEYRGSARQRPTASGPCCSAHPTENLTSGTRDGGESAPAAHLRRVITKFEHDTDLPTRIEDISRIALRFARAN